MELAADPCAGTAGAAAGPSVMAGALSGRLLMGRVDFVCRDDKNLKQLQKVTRVTVGDVESGVMHGPLMPSRGESARRAGPLCTRGIRRTLTVLTVRRAVRRTHELEAPSIRRA